MERTTSLSRGLTQGGPGGISRKRRSNGGDKIHIPRSVKIRTTAIRPNARRVFLSIYLGKGSKPPEKKDGILKHALKLTKKP